jgi:hypothetical protein
MYFFKTAFDLIKNIDLQTQQKYDQDLIAGQIIKGTENMFSTSLF